MHPEINMVIDCCLDLHDEGKKPSVALVKAKLGKQVSFPAIVTGLKKWPEATKQHTKNQHNNEKHDESLINVKTTDERISKLEAKVLRLETLVEHLQKINIR